MIEQKPTFVMPDHILDADTPVGDVVAARRAAIDLLSPLPPADIAMLAQLAMTASLMMAQLDADGAVSLAQARRSLAQLIQGHDDRALKCRVQFVRYTALELAAQPPWARLRLARWFDRRFEIPGPATSSSRWTASPV